MKKPFFNTPTLFTFLLVFGLSVTLSACSNNEKPKPKYKTIQTLNQQQKIETGTVVAVKNIQIKPEANNSYGNIGIVASSGGFRGIHGSIDLGTLSRIFKNSTDTISAQEIIVKKDNGPTVAITQIAQKTFKQGDKVKVLVRNGKAQVIR